MCSYDLPERLVDELEREMEKILEAGINPEEAKTADANGKDAWEADKEEGEGVFEDSREERKADSADGREERKVDGTDSREERQVDSEGGREERKTDREGGREEREEDSKDSEEERSGIWQKITGVCQSVYRKIAGICRKIAKVPEKIGNTLQGIGSKVQGLIEKKDKIIGFLSDEVHQTAFMKARDEVLFLLRRLKPRTIRADIHYGFEDPSLTGKVLAGLSICYPFFGDGVDIRPDFEKKVLDGHLTVKGIIRAGSFFKLLWKLLWSREVRMTYRHVRKFEL